MPAGRASGYDRAVPSAAPRGVETSGDWLYDIGMPGKSGIGGGILAVSPGKGGFAAFAPPLDAYGNSVRGQLAAKYLSQYLGMDLFVSNAEA